MDLGSHEADYLAQSHWHHFRYRVGEMIGLDRERREVQVAPFVDEDGDAGHAAARAFRYDTLVHRRRQPDQRLRHAGRAASTRSRSKRCARRARFHRQLVNACIRAHAQPEPLRPEQLHVAIIGAGATGVELAAELHRTTRTLVSYGLDRIDPDKDIKLILIEAADRILPALPERLSKAATELLDKLGVEVRTAFARRGGAAEWRAARRPAR